MRVLAFRHAAGEELGNIRSVLESRGIEVECVDLFADAAVPDPAGAAGLVFMGGPMCANDDLPFLRRGLELIRLAAARQQPIFGVCLGSQLIARALGGRVYQSLVEETGWRPIRIHEAAASDRLFSPLRPVQEVFQFHQDTFDLPRGATLLASSEACAHQAFRCGDNIYGVQFHPEMTPGMIEDWAADLGVDVWEEPPGACGRLAAMCDQLLGGWSSLL